MDYLNCWRNNVHSDAPYGCFIISVILHNVVELFKGFFYAQAPCMLYKRLYSSLVENVFKPLNCISMVLLGYWVYYGFLQYKIKEGIYKLCSQYSNLHYKGQMIKSYELIQSKQHYLCYNTLIAKKSCLLTGIQEPKS